MSLSFASDVWHSSELPSFQLDVWIFDVVFLYMKCLNGFPNLLFKLHSY